MKDFILWEFATDLVNKYLLNFLIIYYKLGEVDSVVKTCPLPNCSLFFYLILISFSSVFLCHDVSLSAPSEQQVDGRHGDGGGAERKHGVINIICPDPFSQSSLSLLQTPHQHLRLPSVLSLRFLCCF